MSRVTLIRVLVLVFLGAVSAASAVGQARYPDPWQLNGKACDNFCWNGPYSDNSDEVRAWGNQWVSENRSEKPLEWVTNVRCIKAQHLCIVARNQALSSGGTMTNIDLYSVREWSNYQVRANEEWGMQSNCEKDTLLINRADSSVSLLSAPGPEADRSCRTLLKPKTV